MWPFKAKLKAGDPNDLFRELAAASNGERTKMDIYREFRLVFLGSPEGKRVLNDILTWCHMGHSSMKPGVNIDPYNVVAQEAERRIGLKISTALSAEPSAKPTKQNR